MAPSRTRERNAIRLYRGFLRLYPADFREEYGHELCLVFQDRWREQRTLAALFLVWLNAIFGILSEAPKEHYHMLVQDIRYAFRVLGKDRGVTAAAIAILALGIGSSTVVFSLANGVLIRPLPYFQPRRIVAVREYNPQDPRESGQINFPNYADMRARTRLLEDIGVYENGAVTLRGNGLAERIPAAGVSDGIFRILGVTPLLGRGFTAEEARFNGPQVVILSEELWQRRYRSDPNIVGKALDADDKTHMIVGVMPGDFHFPDRSELWFPMQMDLRAARRSDYFLHAVGRLKPGVTVEQATSELESMLEQIHRENPTSNNGWKARAIDYRESLSGSYREALLALLVAVGLLLTLACANVSNLLLVKASSRTREMAVRTALGATRPRLIRLLVSESVILGLGGGVLGVVLAYLGVPALLSLIPVELPLWMNFAIDERVLAFALGVCFVTSIAFGIAPALAASGVDITKALKEGGRGSGASLRQKLLRNGLVVAEIAISVTLLAGAGLMVRSFIALRMQNLGYQPERVLTTRVAYPEKRYQDGAPAHVLLRRLTDDISSLKGVTSMAFSSGVPLNDGWGRIYTIEGRPVPLNEMPIINHIVITPGYFRTLGIPLITGRDFTEADFGAPNLVIVSNSFAKEHWPHESAIGKRMRFGPPKNDEPWHTVVGVAADSRHGQLKGEDRANVYLPYNADITPSNLLVRTTGDPRKLAKAIQGRIAGVDGDIALTRIYTLEQIIDRVAWQDRFWTVLLTVFSLLALLLAAVGLYAVLSYTVSLNKREIGIRVALGASASSIRGFVMRQGMALTGAGLVLGILAALALTRLLKSLLYETSPMDPATYLTAPVILMLVAWLAAFLPTRRAIRVDPVDALRQD
jgi:putative ABC transport system permease protein